MFENIATDEYYLDDYTGEGEVFLDSIYDISQDHIQELKFESEGNTMNISNNLKALILCIFGTPLFAGGHSNGHPILTPLEPEAMNGSYTKMLMGENEFKENSGFDEKTYQLVALAASAGIKCEY